MTILRLEHAISDFDVWKATFDRDPVGREESGVRGHRLYRPLDDPNYIAVDLEFDDSAAAKRFQVALGDLWRSREASPALVGTPHVRIVETVEQDLLGRDDPAAPHKRGVRQPPSTRASAGISSLSPSNTERMI